MNKEIRDRLEQAGLDPARLPEHVAIIMDGNGRWASSRGLPRLEGHSQGYKTVRTIIRFSGELGLKALTLYTFSAENWTRPEGEVTGIMRLIGQAASRELSELTRNDVQLRLSGRLSELPDYVRDPLLADVERTRNNQGLIVNLAINYGGRTEIVDAVRKIAEDARAGMVSPEEIDEKMLAGLLYQPDLPEPDLLIRTAGEMRISNFLLWQCAYSELHVTPVLWPDFGEDDLLKAISDFQGRVRKFGGVPGAGAAEPIVATAPTR